MGRNILFNAFEMNCVAHQSPGLWRHPRDRSRDYRSLKPWIALAQTLERGLFDGLFLADVLGVYDVFGGNPEAALAHAAQVPVNDPLLLVPAMAAATEHLGFGVTVTLSYEPPFPFARRMSTLDHLTEGRIGWNIVTGYLDSAARGSGQGSQRGHDDRYAAAEDYMEVVYKLWEGSWADDAVVADRRAGVFTRPDGVRRVIHEGPHYRLDAIHLSEPSPQRTPVLYQAGTSPAGRACAAQKREEARDRIRQCDGRACKYGAQHDCRNDRIQHRAPEDQRNDAMPGVAIRAHEHAAERKKHHDLCEDRHRQRARPTLAEEGEHQRRPEETQVADGGRSRMRACRRDRARSGQTRCEQNKHEDDYTRRKVARIKARIKCLTQRLRRDEPQNQRWKRKTKREYVERIQCARCQEMRARGCPSHSDDSEDRQAEQKEADHSCRPLRASIAVSTATMSASPRPSASVSP